MTYFEYKLVRQQITDEGILPVDKETIKMEYNSIAITSILLNKYVSEFWCAVGKELGIYWLLDKLTEWLEKLRGING